MGPELNIAFFIKNFQKISKITIKINGPSYWSLKSRIGQLTNRVWRQNGELVTSTISDSLTLKLLILK